MDKDVKKELEELFRKCNMESERRGEKDVPYVAPIYNDNDHIWLLGILSLLMLDRPDSKSKQPSINIYMGGDK